ncbi:cytochrome b560 subunit of succinate dehydrogenase [Pseudovirgaria hyperparasitica]|uniref:Cytochrome b560 subunit of succinate dehydrogenase n=1 Tax=Pseudovirgaria hyperparasitica TaxID=470096 RepID=A0A6A6VWQ9_9PEZI|nr:cytochrome b560 subunit of succinate dehydrogenase [Pseudovirgaria hyperparasitica]KAF2754653.1 cytochrome b560 subunit of succinate dehydrogenase [Pseudovirgaria hyperparasitica]
MTAPRALQLGLRRTGLGVKSTFNGFKSRIAQRRVASTQTTSESAAADNILVKQRLARPVSPHLGIYQANIAMYGSAFNRITGSILSGAFYIFGFAYLAAPTIGWHIETPSMVAAVGSWPIWAKIATKFSVAFPFLFHSLNGVRHLVWDTGRGFATKTTARSGWVVVAASVVGSAILTSV